MVYEARPKYNRKSEKWNIVCKVNDAEIELGREINGFVKYTEFDSKQTALDYIEKEPHLKLELIKISKEE